MIPSGPAAAFPADRRHGARTLDRSDPRRAAGLAVEPDRHLDRCPTSWRASLAAVRAARRLHHRRRDLPGADATTTRRSRRCRWATTVIVINSFSKYFNMTGWRLGWLVVPDALVRAIRESWRRTCSSARPASPSMRRWPASRRRRIAIYERAQGRIPAPPRLHRAGAADAGLRACRSCRTARSMSMPTAAASHSADGDADRLTQAMLHEAGVVLVPGLDFGPHTARAVHPHLVRDIDGPHRGSDAAARQAVREIETAIAIGQSRRRAIEPAKTARQNESGAANQAAPLLDRALSTARLLPCADPPRRHQALRGVCAASSSNFSGSGVCSACVLVDDGPGSDSVASGVAAGALPRMPSTWRSFARSASTLAP